jgi:ectoine hydroxylase-related dioxygenase (phytanoyl-CoA dioxygenase family)
MTATSNTKSLPDLSSRYEVSDAQVREFQENGHVFLPGVCSAEEVAAYRQEILEATAERRAAVSDLSTRDTYGKAFIQMTNLWEEHEGTRRFVYSKRLAQIATDLMDVSGARLYHDQALFKEAHGGFTPWHQDQFFWPLDSKAITIWMPLVDLTEDMGIMKFASKSHTLGYLADIGGISDDSEAQIDEVVRGKGLELNGQVVMKAGDATFHDGWTLHRAPGNRTDTMREVMTVIYFTDGAKVLEPDNDNREADRDAWLKRQPGEIADGELNPVLYSRNA